MEQARNGEHGLRDRAQQGQLPQLRPRLDRGEWGPSKKPWTVATSSKKLADRLEQYQCAGPSMHLMHHPCAGKETKRTEGYVHGRDGPR